MLLALDLGNTNLTIGLFSGDVLVADWRVRTDRDRTTDEHGILITNLLRHRSFAPESIRGIAISSVVPTMTDGLAHIAPRYFDVDPWVAGRDTDYGIRVDYDHPSDVGADRVLNAVAVHAIYGGPAIVVDLGTGTTFDAIAENGDYLGGAIAPGIGIATDALFQRAARLYRVELEYPDRAIGKNTVGALQSGIMFGYTGLVDALVDRFRDEMGARALVIATGGLAEVIRSRSRTIQVVDQMLTLHGLRILWERNRAVGSS